MPISQRDRKMLWARSYGLCALCRSPLIQEADSSSRAGIILGEEAHIVAKRKNGPRGLSGPRENIDSYQNLILLCLPDHKKVDEQPDFYTVEYLLSAKADHEKWAANKLAAPQPLHVLKPPEEDEIPMQLVPNGETVWKLVANAHLFNIRSLPDDDKPDESDAADAFLTAAKEWGEIADVVEDQGLTSVSNAQRSLSELLAELHTQGLFVFGKRVTRTLTGGIGEPSPFHVAFLIVVREDEIEVTDASTDAAEQQRQGSSST